MRDYVTRREYEDWIRDAAALARALRYPIHPSMVNDSAGIVYGPSQYAAFESGLWSGVPYEIMIIFEALNEAAVDGLPASAEAYAPYSGLCDKLMILHPGKFCPPHYHLYKTECYEVVMGQMDVFYCDTPVDTGEQTLSFEHMPPGDRWPTDVALPQGREASYERLTNFVRLEAADPKFVLHRQHLHAFRCPQDASVPLVVREISTYSHEPTEAAKDKPVPFDGWRQLHDNYFLDPEAHSGRLVTNIRH
ncbi:hypothetical protein [Trueperella sp. LYQ141]|uniref:hypothetical protein n=1 Tax=Trueperella sp. LYQ141 TaxID=3391058 RepID=UPI0039832C28